MPPALPAAGGTGAAAPPGSGVGAGAGAGAGAAAGDPRVKAPAKPSFVTGDAYVHHYNPGMEIRPAKEGGNGAYCCPFPSRVRVRVVSLPPAQ